MFLKHMPQEKVLLDRMSHGGSSIFSLTEPYFIIVIIFIFFLIIYFCWCNNNPTQKRKTIVLRQKKKRIKRAKEIESRKSYSILDIVSLARYYHVGVDDVYLPDGTKVPGVRPDGNKAVFYYKLAAKNGYDSALYDIGMIYEHGCGNLESNVDIAKEYYERLMNNTFDNGLRLSCYDRIKKINDAQHRDNPGNNVPRNIAVLFDYPQEPNNIAIILNRPQERNNAPAPAPYTDAQNTHDSLLNKTARDSLYRISNRNENTNDNRAEALAEIRNFINNYANNDKRTDALRVLDTMTAHNQYVTNFDKNEVDVLVTVWNRIKTGINKEYVENTKETLVDYLADSVEHGVVTCATGRTNRVMNALNIVDPEVTLKNGALINEEILNKSSAIRNKLYEELTEEMQKKVDTDTPESIEFTENLKQKIKETVEDEYVNKGIITAEQSEKILSKWIDHL